MEIPAVLGSSAVVAAFVGGLITLLSQRWLLKRKAQLDYEFAARKRLYEAIGVLRLQLLLAARDVVRRIRRHPKAESWDMRPSDHYVKSSIYRLLRPIAIGQIIEKEIGTVDLSIDADALELLRFNAAVAEMLTGGNVLLEHPGADWSAAQSQHLFHHNLNTAAATLIIATDTGVDRVMDYAQFERAVPDPMTDPVIGPLASIFGRCKETLFENPIFWLRLVGYAYACNRFVGMQGKRFRFASATLEVERMLSDERLKDEHISTRAAKYLAAFEAIVKGPL